jgi:hypothetical protein
MSSPLIWLLGPPNERAKKEKRSNKGIVPFIHPSSTLITAAGSTLSGVAWIPDHPNQSDNEIEKRLVYQVIQGAETDKRRKKVSRDAALRVEVKVIPPVKRRHERSE